MSTERNIDVSTVPCPDYSEEKVRIALEAVLKPLGGLDWVRSGMTVGIKANLVSSMKPEEGATTHPTLICELTRMLRERGAEVIIGDSPGGLYTAQYLGKVYDATGMSNAEVVGARLNRNFETAHAEYADAAVLRSFTYTSWLDECDGIINFCKLKTHGMMGMSAAAKNMFGVIPGTMKPEYHYRFPNLQDFSRMIVDLDEYFKPRLCIVDAIEGMEGNGPTKGSVRHIGLLLASASPHKLDMVCADIIGLGMSDIPTLMAAKERGLVPDSLDGLCISGNYAELKLPDYKNVAVRNSMLFDKNSKALRVIMGSLLQSRPRLRQSECVGCGKCRDMCPAKAIAISEKKKAVIDRDKCIRCFCCQEFCPVGAMKVYRTPVARLLSK